MANSSRIKGITIEIDGDSTKLQDAIKGANTAIRSSQAQLKDLNKLLKLDPGNTELLKQKYSTLGKEIDDTKRKLDTLKQAEQQMNSAGQTDTAEWDALQREIAETEQNLKSLTDEYKSFGSVAAQQVAVAGEKVKEFGSTISDVGSNLTKGVTVPIVGAATASVAAWNEVDKAMDTVVTKTGASGDALEDMRKRVKNIAQDIATSLKNAADAVGEVNTRFGLTGDVLEDTAKRFVKFAELNNTDVSSSIDKVQGAMEAFDVPAKDAGYFLDVLTKAGQDTGISMDTLIPLMTTNAAGLKELGLSASDSAMFLANLSKNGIDASAAMAGLKKAYAKSLKDGTSMTKVLADLEERLQNTDTYSDAAAEAIELFGTRAGGALVDAVSEGRLSFEALGTSLSDYAGIVENTFDETLDPLDQMQTNMNTLKILGAELVNTSGPMIATFMQKLAGIIRGLSIAWNGLSGEQQQMVIKIALTAAAIGPLLVVLGKLTTSVGSIMTWAPKIMSGISSIGGGIKGLWGIIAAHPFVLIIAAVTAVVVAIAANWDKIYSWTVEKFTAVKKWLADTWDKILGSISEKLSNISAAISEKWSEIKASISEKVTGALQTVQQKFEAIRSSINEKLSNALQSVREKWETITSWIREKATGALQTVRDKFEAIRSSIGEKLTAAKNTVANVFDSIKEGIRSKIEGARDLVRSAVEKIKSFFNFSWSLPKIKLPHFSISGSFSLNPPSIPHIGVSWYKKAMDNAMVLDRATIFGAAGGQLLGGGEAGREVISGESHLLDMINASVDSAIGQRMDSVLGLLEQYLPGCAQTKVALPVSSLSRALAQQTVREAGGW